MPKLDPRDARIAELEALLEAALGRITQLEAKVAKLEAENAELRTRLGQNSQNSSKPPSSDPPGVSRQAKSPTGRRPGGQPGHERTRQDETAGSLREHAG